VIKINLVKAVTEEISSTWLILIAWKAYVYLCPIKEELYENDTNEKNCSF
jgi:hypothetical protein